MQRKDVILKEYQRDSGHFCDFVNGVLAQGKPLFRSEQVIPMPTELVAVKDTESEEDNVVVKTVQRFRDITGRAGTNDRYVIVAIQNQTKADYGMPLRVMLEDALEYDVQRRMKEHENLHKGEKLGLVITLVFYYGTSPWNAPTDLAEMVSVPQEFEELKEYIRSYPIVLVTPENVEPGYFQGGWREIFEVLRRQNSEREMKRYLEENQEIYEKLPEDTNRVIFALTDHLEYYDELKKKGEKAKVCKAFEDHYKSGVEEGKQLGIEQGKQLGMEQGRRLGITEGIRALIETCRKFSISRNDTRNSIISQFQIPEESAERYMAKYWQ